MPCANPPVPFIRDSAVTYFTAHLGAKYIQLFKTNC